MRKKHLRLGAVAVLGLGLFMAACNKNDDTGPSSTPNEIKLTAHAWSITTATLSNNTATDSLFYITCMEDDTLTFGRSHNFYFSDGTEVCDSTLLPYGNGIWVFNTAEDTLLLKYSDTTINWQVEALTDSTLQVNYADSLDHEAVTKTLKFVTKE